MVVAEDGPQRRQAGLRAVEHGAADLPVVLADPGRLGRLLGERPEARDLGLDGRGQSAVDRVVTEPGLARRGDELAGAGRAPRRDGQLRVGAEQRVGQARADRGDGPGLELRVAGRLDAPRQPVPALLFGQHPPPALVGGLPACGDVLGPVPALDGAEMIGDRQVVGADGGVERVVAPEHPVPQVPGAGQGRGPLPVGFGPQPEELVEDADRRVAQPPQGREDLGGGRLGRGPHQHVLDPRGLAAEALGGLDLVRAAADLPRRGVHRQAAEPEGVAPVEVDARDRGQVDSSVVKAPTLLHARLRSAATVTAASLETPTATAGPVPRRSG